MFVFQGHFCFGSSVSWIIKKKKKEKVNMKMSHSLYFFSGIVFFLLHVLYKRLCKVIFHIRPCRQLKVPYKFTLPKYSKNVSQACQ